MPSFINKKWWNEEKIKWYERASLTSSFHSFIAQELSKRIDIDESIAELGCGLGHTAEILFKEGYNIKAYDIDKRAIKRAKKRSNLDIFEVKDCLSLDFESETVFSIFFLHYDSLLAKKIIDSKQNHFLFILKNESSITEKKKERKGLEEFLLKIKESNFEIKINELPEYSFDQSFINLKEAKKFVSSYYKKNERKKALSKVIKNEINISFPFLLKNTKKTKIIELKRITK